VRAAAAAGAAAVQFRSKQGTTRELYREAAALRELCRPAPYIVNDRADLAMAVGADGLHVGQDDLPCPVARQLLGPDRIVGVSVGSAAEALEAERAGADYVAVSPLFATRTKEDAGAGHGLEVLRQVRQAVRVPVVAIGGIDLANAPEVIAAGADAICAVSATVRAADVEAEIRRFQRLFGR
jgi:thiamine-phosphate pyrophosphorylase